MRGEDRVETRGAAKLVLGSLAVLLVIRFFTGTISILPGAATFVDVPILAMLVLAAVTRPQRGATPQRSQFFLVAAFLFLAIAVLATLANLDRVALSPVLMFLYSFLSPLVIFYAVYQLWPPGEAGRLSQLVLAIGLLQLVVVASLDVPEFLATRNPDDITGTFGENAYQLVFFLIVFTTLVAAMTVFQPKRLPRFAAPAIFAATAAVIFLAQYRALLPTILLTVIVASVFLVRARPGPGLVVSALALLAFFGTLSYVSERFPVTKLQSTTAAIQQDPMFFVETRLGIVDDVLELHSEEPRYLVTGTGPATYSSRSWRTFADPAESGPAVTIARTLNALQGGPYETDVANSYTIPRMQTAPVIMGSRALTWPLSSYTSLLAEVGLLGFIVLIGTYAAALLYACRLTMRSIRQRLPDDPLPAIALTAAVAFTVLLQLAALENWLEVTRVTFIAWLLLAVAAKESDARVDT